MAIRRFSAGALRKMLLLTALILALGSTAGLGAAAAAPAKPTVVLVHGAFADASSWDGVATQLRGQGYPVVVPDNPLRGPSNDAAVIKRTLDAIAGPVVLVGHSYGGEVITNAARNATNVKALLYVSAIVPAQGEPAALTIDPIRYPGSELLPPAVLPKIVDDAQGPAGKNLDLYITADRFRDVFAADVPVDKVAEMVARQKSFALTANLKPSGPPAYENHPSWWLLPTQDRVVPPSAQRAMAARAQSQVTEIAGSHAILVSQPGAVVSLVNAADAATP